MTNYYLNVSEVHKTTKGSLTWYTRIYFAACLNLRKGFMAVKYHWFPVTEPPVSVYNEIEHVVSSQFKNKCHLIVPDPFEYPSFIYPGQKSRAQC